MKLLLILFTLTTYAHASDIKVAAGLLNTTQTVKRGIVTYEGHLFTPIVSIEKEDFPFMIAGSSIYYKKNLFNDYIFRSRLNFNSTGDRPSYFTETSESKTLQREYTNELDLFFEKHGKNHYMRFQISKDLNAHKSNYYELHLRYALFDYKRENVKAIIQPSFYSALGYGDKEHNEYFYGEGAGLGINNVELGFIVASPNVIDPFWPTLKFSYFEILNEDNTNALFVKDKHGLSFELLIAFRIF